jgi:beta-glucanase (GH16 family)
MRLLVACLFIPLLLPAQKPFTFSDEFNGSELDLFKWVPHDPWALARTPDPPTVSAGELHLKAGQTLTTFGLFSQVYGRFEIRFRVPVSGGNKALFRLLPIPLGPLPSIDILSYTGAELFFGNRWGTEQTERTFGDSVPMPAPGLHTVAIEWDRAKLAWSVDGKDKLNSTDGVPQQPMFLLIEGPMDIDFVHVSPSKLN